MRLIFIKGFDIEVIEIEKNQMQCTAKTYLLISKYHNYSSVHIYI